MLNKKQERELAYVVTIDAIRPIEGKDRVECAVVGGWTVMVRKDQFKVGDPAIYFEIDSKVPATEPFAFLEQKKYHIKTQKYRAGEGQFWSQGLLMAAEDFGWKKDFAQFAGDVAMIIDDKGVQHIAGDEDSMFLTQQLGVTYYEAEDNTRKAPSADKYKKMAQRHGKLFSKQPFRWLMKRDWGKKLLFVFFGKKKDKRTWPSWVVKTDEERAENLSHLLWEDGAWRNVDWIATEKIDGTSTTFTMKRSKGFKKNEFYVCSRNVVFDKPDKTCYYDTNVYLEMAEKYDIENVLNELLKANPEAEWVTIQGETYGAGIQKRDYGMKDHDFAAFNLIWSDKGRVNSIQMARLLFEWYHIPCVPIVAQHYQLPNNIEELREFVHSQKSVVDDGMREGIVFRSHDGLLSFKCVDPEFLVKYHG